jgi:drug/metabolite transporter (DMT)-like permease
MRTAHGRVTGHTGTPTAIRVPVVPVYAAAPTIRKAAMPAHRDPEREAWHFAIRMIVWAGALCLLVAAVFLFRAVMHEPVGAATPGTYVSPIGYPPSP